MSSQSSIRFERFCLDLAVAQVRRDDEVLPLSPKAVAVLHYLATHPHQVVTKSNIRQAVWPEIGGSDAALKVCISELRKALDDNATPPRLIETHPGQGYRFIAPITTATPPILGLETRDLGLVPAPPPPAWQAPSPQSPVPKAQYSALSTQHSVLVGRDAELAHLYDRWTKALDGERQVVFISGEPGIGKTTLIEAFRQRLETGDWRLVPAPQASRFQPPASEVWVGWGQCIEHYGAGEAYLPILEALGRLGREPDGEQVIAALAQYATTWLAQLPALVNPTEHEALQRMLQGATHERMLREIADALEALTARSPLILMLEDLHWSDQSTLELPAYLARRRGPARLLILGTYRPMEGLASGNPLRGVVQELQGREHSVELRLGLLSEAEVRAYVANRFPTLTIPPQLPAVLHQRTEGNPLFMVTVVEQLVRERVIAETAGQWRVNEDLTLLERGTPESLRQLIQRQCESLPVDTQQVLVVASVVGAEFGVAAVAAGTGQGVEIVEEQCAALAARGQFLWAVGIEEWPDGTLGGRYRFLHALYQHVLYDRMTEIQQVRLHRRIGERKATAYGERAGEIASELAVHFEKGRDLTRAVHYLGKAGENAVRRSAHQEAIFHLTKGLDLLTTFPETPEHARQELQLHLTLGTSLMATKGYAAPELERIYARARELCQQLKEPPQLLAVLGGLWVFYATRARLQTARELAEQYLTVACTRQRPTSFLWAHCFMGQTLYGLGRLRESRTHFEQSLRFYDPRKHNPRVATSPQDPGETGLAYLARVLWLLGYPEQALEKSREACNLAQNLVHPYSLTHALSLSASLHQLRGEAPAARKQAEAAIALLNESGSPYRLAQGTILWGWALAEQGKPEEGISQMRHGLTAWQVSGAELWRPYYLSLLTSTLAIFTRQEGGYPL
jgi:DNA-binding winged helix-turn-helix (wHTH) protein/tetratricopeptide (TPR) repeat protein